MVILWAQKGLKDKERSDEALMINKRYASLQACQTILNYNKHISLKFWYFCFTRQIWQLFTSTHLLEESH